VNRGADIRTAAVPSDTPATIRAVGVADAKGRRFDAATGIGFAVLAVVALVLPGAPPKADEPAAKIVTFFADHRGKVLAASFLLGLAALLFLWFLGSLRSYLRAAEGGEGRLSAAAFGGGVAGIALVLAGVAALNGIAFKLARTAGADPNVARGLFDASSAVIATSAFGFAVFFGAASCSGARSGALPPWAYWSGTVVTVLQVVAGLALVVDSGFLATGGAMGFIAPGTGLLWVVGVSALMMSRDGVPPVARTEP
jgi:hypothetical protein